MELRDLYDVRRQPMNRLQMWGEPIPEGCCHIAVFIQTFTYDGRLLLIKRNACKPGGLLWEVTGDSALHGGISQEGTKRELYEKTDISCRMEQLQRLHIRAKGQEIYDHYLLQHPVELDKSQLQEEEIIDAMLVDQPTSEDVMRVNILTHPLQLWYHELRDMLVAYFQKSRWRQI